MRETVITVDTENNTFRQEDWGCECDRPCELREEAKRQLEELLRTYWEEEIAEVVTDPASCDAIQDYCRVTCEKIVLNS